MLDEGGETNTQLSYLSQELNERSQEKWPKVGRGDGEDWAWANNLFPRGKATSSCMYYYCCTVLSYY